jgi:hypothetical protein
MELRPTVSGRGRCKRLRLGPAVRPAVGVNDLAQRPAGQWTEFAAGITDRHQGVSLHLVRQSQHLLDFVFVEHVVGRDQRAQAERAAGKNYVLDHGMDARAGAPHHVLALILEPLPNHRRQRAWRRQLLTLEAGDEQTGAVASRVPDRRRGRRRDNGPRRSRRSGACAFSSPAA